MFNTMPDFDDELTDSEAVTRRNVGQEQKAIRAEERAHADRRAVAEAERQRRLALAGAPSNTLAGPREPSTGITKLIEHAKKMSIEEVTKASRAKAIADHDAAIYRAAHPEPVDPRTSAQKLADQLTRSAK
jgi:hypothetical protein